MERPRTRAGRDSVSSATREDNRPLSRRGEQLNMSASRSSSRLSSSISSQSSGRPPSSARPPSAARPVSVARPPSAFRSTSRLSSASGLPPPKMPGTGATQFSDSDRLVTQQGLSGLRTGSALRGPGFRQVQDKRYYEGLLQLKIRDLTNEITRLKRQIELSAKEHATFLLYDKRVKEMATELTELQGKLSDYNLTMDKVNTQTNIADIEEEYLELRAANDIETRHLEEQFTERSKKQHQLHELEAEIEKERKHTESIIESMDPDLKNGYLELQAKHKALLHQMDTAQEQVDTLSYQTAVLREKMSGSSVKLEAVQLYEQLAELEEQYNALLEEEESKLNPEQEREKLLLQIKNDNYEISNAEANMQTVENQIKEAEAQLEQLNQDLEESHSEKHQKYMELKKREDIIETFLSSFDETRRAERDKISHLESTIVATLNQQSRHMATLPPTQSDLQALRNSSNQSVVSNSDKSVETLQTELRQLNLNLAKVEAMDTKIKLEIESLNEQIASMRKDIVVYEDIDGLKNKAEAKRSDLMKEKQALLEEKEILLEQQDSVRKSLLELQSQLDQNDSYIQLSNQEKRLAQIEQTNYTLDEFIKNKLSETNFVPVKDKCLELVEGYNRLLKVSYQDTVHG
ncbi:hypothetical protein M8J77_008670 [Diaphorina citri]|nr:hypothetical protein M8J77_008670 [Diaphorina citri]